MKGLIIFNMLLVTSVFAGEPMITPSKRLIDTLLFIDRPDFFENQNANDNDTSTFSCFINEQGIIDYDNTNYKDAITYRVTFTVKKKQIAIKEYINKGNGIWYAIFYNENGSIVMQGSLKETGKILEANDTVGFVNPEPPYTITNVIYLYHETHKEGDWIIHELQWPFNKHRIRYINGIEQQKK